MNKRFTPTPPQRKFLAAIKAGDWATASFVPEPTRRACRCAGWITDSTIRPSVTELGRYALQNGKEPAHD